MTQSVGILSIIVGGTLEKENKVGSLRLVGEDICTHVDGDAIIPQNDSIRRPFDPSLDIAGLCDVVIQEVQEVLCVVDVSKEK